MDETWSTNTVLAAHGLRKAAQRNIEELLHHLIADNSAARVDSPSDQPRRLRCFLGARASKEYTKMFVSRKNLPLIQLVPAEAAAGLNML